MKTILVTGIGGLTPRSITGIIRENHRRRDRGRCKASACDKRHKRLRGDQTA